MRAPTIEGYAARHSKLSKSVTFNRDTLQSPPNSANSTNQANLFSYNNNNNNNNTITTTSTATTPITEQSFSVVPNNNHNHNKTQMKLIKDTLDDEQQYFADILSAIKQVMSHHLQEMQEKFHQRFEKLEQELQNKDDLINQLKQHISELERTTEESLTDSFDTVISRERHSWDETSHEEIEELQELPQRPLTPLHAWSSSSSNTQLEGGSGGVIVDIDSTTDTDDDYSSSQQSGYSSNSDNQQNRNWEMELLAQQMREKRSASLDDQNCGGSGRPIRRRFTRSGSADSRND